jgi:hypothetical protein
MAHRVLSDKFKLPILSGMLPCRPGFPDNVLCTQFTRSADGTECSMVESYLTTISYTKGRFTLQLWG